MDSLSYAHRLIRATEQQKDRNTTFAVPITRLRKLCTDHIELAEAEPPAPEEATEGGLTDRERECLQVIKDKINNLERPTVRNVAEAMKYKTPNSARVIIDRLVEYKLIDKVGAKKQIVLK